MKDLITAETVKEMAAKGGGRVVVTPNTILTPAARDQAEAMGLEIVEEISPETTAPSEKSRKIGQAVVELLRQEFGDQPVDEDTVRTIVTRVLERLG
jgi:hypothetical protein